MFAGAWKGCSPTLVILVGRDRMSGEEAALAQNCVASWVSLAATFASPAFSLIVKGSSAVPQEEPSARSAMA